MREHYTLPTFEEISAKMAKTKVFSVLDASQAFWKILLSEESSKFTTFSTPFGRRISGLSSASEIVHRCFSKLFADIEGVVIYIDDIMIFAETREEHEKILAQVLKCGREYGVKFNLQNSKFAVEEIKYMGHEFSEAGI